MWPCYLDLAQALCSMCKCVLCPFQSSSKMSWTRVHSRKIATTESVRVCQGMCVFCIRNIGTIPIRYNQRGRCKDRGERGRYRNNGRQGKTDNIFSVQLLLESARLLGAKTAQSVLVTADSSFNFSNSQACPFVVARWSCRHP